MGRRRRYENNKEDIEDLYGEIRSLRKIVRNQQREIARLRKYEQRAAHEKSQPPEFDKESPKKHVSKRTAAAVCGKCRSTDITTMDLEKWVYLICRDCNYRKKLG